MIPGTQAVYSCDAHHNLEGSNTITCQDSGDWDRSEPPTCTLSKLMFSSVCLRLRLKKLNVFSAMLRFSIYSPTNLGESNLKTVVITTIYKKKVFFSFKKTLLLNYNLLKT